MSGGYGDWRLRQDGIEEALQDLSPDVVCLTEAWTTAHDRQAELVARRLGYAHHESGGGWELDGWTSGFGLASRWPVASVEQRPLGDGNGASTGSAFFTRIDGDRGPIDVFTVMLHYPLDGSAVRCRQLEQLGAFIEDAASRRNPVIVCGDFNAGPDSDEIRAFTGRTAPICPGIVFYDAWEVAGGWKSRDYLVQSKSAGSGRYVPGSALRLRVVGMAPERCDRAPDALRARRRPRSRPNSALGPLRRGR